MNLKGPAFVSTRRFNLLEMAIVALLAVLLSVLLGRWFLSFVEQDERSPLSRTYGPSRYSEHEEEWAIRDYFHDRRNGFFVDVGANDYKTYSNTYYLEKVLGWSGIAVEPQREFEEGYRQNRPRTRFLPVFVGEKSNEIARLWVGANKLAASADKDFTSRWNSRLRSDPNLREETVPTITLNDLLDQQEAAHVDLLSIDIELHEPQALAGFDIERFRPSLVCIEAHPEVRQRILDYFTTRRYVVVGKYVRADVHNLYFAPLSQR